MKASMSVLSDELFGNMQFDTIQTIQQSDITGETNRAYLRFLGVEEIDKEYNAAVDAFEEQLREQEIAAKLSAKLASETQANLAVETQAGLGTGAQAVQAEGRQQQLGNVYSEIDTNIAAAYSEQMGAFAESYKARLESIFGEYDETTKTFKGLTEYNQMADRVAMAMTKVMAKLIDPDVEDEKYEELLKERGYLISEGDGIYSLTEDGRVYVDMLINGNDPNEPRKEWGDKSLVQALAEEMGKEDYKDKEQSWDELSPSARDKIREKYEDWIIQNQSNLRVSEWDLYEETEEGITPDIYFKLPEPPADVGIVYTKDGEAAGQLLGQFDATDHPRYKDKSKSLEPQIAQVKEDIASGKIKNGSYVYIAKHYFYYSDGMIYKTKYDYKNPLPKISLDSADVYSFGKFRDTDTGKGKQDEWVNDILRMARAGRIPAGTYIDFNFGDYNIDGAGKYVHFFDGENFTRVKRSQAEEHFESYIFHRRSSASGSFDGLSTTARELGLVAMPTWDE